MTQRFDWVLLRRLAGVSLVVTIGAVASAMLWRVAAELAIPVNGQDEAIVLLYADRLLEGDLAYVDYESVYPLGLGALLVLPSLFVGNDLLLIRLIPIALAALMITVFAINRRRVIPPLVLLVVLLGTWPEGALFWQYSLILLGLGLHLLLTRNRHLHPLGAFVIALSAGVRLDFLLVAVPIALLHLRTSGSPFKDATSSSRALWIGYCIGFLPVGIQGLLILRQPGLGEWLYIQRSIGNGRILPIAWRQASIQLIALGIGLGLSVLLAVLLYRRFREIPIFVVAASAGAAVLGGFQALRRFDAVHLQYALGLVAVTASGCTLERSSVKALSMASVAGVALLLLPHVNQLQSLHGYFRISPTLEQRSIEIESRLLCTERRCLTVEPRLADWYQEPLSIINERKSSSVFVGPSDLRTANYSDDWLYLLLDNPVCSRFLEMNPGSSNRPDSGIEKDLADCDFLVLTALYNMPLENDWSRKLFSASRHNNALAPFDLVWSNDVVFLYRNRFSDSS